MSDLDDAEAEVRRRAQVDLGPPVFPAEIESILADNLRYTVWAASTAYEFGAKVRPVARNGHYYICIVAGTSGATQPTFPTTEEAVVSDGSAVWQEVGQDFTNAYNIRRCIEQVWELKAAKGQDLVDFSADGASISAHQTPQFCLKMAERFRSVGIA